MSYDHLNDEELLALRRPPDAGVAFGCFYRRHQRLVVAFHMRRTGDADVAADLTSETFARAIENRARFQNQGAGSAAAWLYGIARFVLSHHLRRAETTRRIEQSLPRLTVVLEDADIAAITEAAHDDQVLAELALLPADQRAAIRGYVLDELDYETLATSFECEVATVRKRVSRGLSSLRETLGATR